MKEIKQKAVRVWLIVTSVLVIFCLLVSILASIPFYRAVCSFLGEERNIVTSGGSNEYYSSEYKTKEAALAHANEVNLKIAREGFVLLKNEDNVLPLETSGGKKKISVFGKNSVNLSYAGSGSAGGDSSKANTLYESLEAAGYSYNEELKRFYEDDARSGSGRSANPKIESGEGIAGFATGETPVSSYAGLESSYQGSDLALVVFSRIGGEGYDLPTTMKKSFTDPSAVEGAMSADDHYFELDKNEQEMLKMVCENFEDVVVVVNSSSPMELGFLEGDDGDGTNIGYDFASHVKGALWIGYPGNSGIMALGEILNGTVNPSGRLVDTYAKDFTEIPSYNNVGLNGVSGADAYAGSSEHFSDYEEGIYVGYRYFETRFETEGENGDKWYAENVVYPFGYGLSYTSFDWKIKETKPAADSEIGKDTSFSVTVTVTNTGDRAGKDVVEVYAAAPYTGKLEKASKVLVGYEKTGLLEPGKSEDVTVTFDSYDFASFDALGGVENGYKGYLLEAGDYRIVVGKNAHEAGMSVGYRLGQTVTFPEKGSVLFDDADDQLGTVLSRSDWEGTWPKRREEGEKTLSDEVKALIASTESGNPLTADSETVKNADLTVAKAKKTSPIQLWQLRGKEYGDELWDEFLKNLTVSTMFDLCSNMGSFGTIAIDYIGKIKTLEEDGPNGFTNFLSGIDVFDTFMYASECVLAATWNDELAYEMGEAIGIEGLVGNTKGTPYSGWYAPGVNIHRSPFGGRNSEYYSEDGMLSGSTAAKVIEGASSKGVYTYMKHFAVNEQETHRAGVCTWLTEQSLREVYLKSFEIAVKKSNGKANAVMSSFNRIGTRWTGGDYRLLTSVLRDEWGFRGAVVTDFADKAYMNNKQMTYAGGDIRLANLEANDWVDKANPVDVYVLKNAAKNVLYVVANSCAMNGIGEGANIRTAMPYWQIGLFVFDGVVGAALIVWGVIVFVKAKKKHEE